MSNNNHVDWNQLINEQDYEDTGGESSADDEGRTVGTYRKHRGDDTISDVAATDKECDQRDDCISGLIVEHPPSSPEVERVGASAVESVNNREEEECEGDILDLYCDETDVCCSEIFAHDAAADNSVMTSNKDKRVALRTGSRAINRGVASSVASSFTTFRPTRVSNEDISKNYLNVEQNGGQTWKGEHDKGYTLTGHDQRCAGGSRTTMIDPSIGPDRRTYKRPSQSARKQRRCKGQIFDGNTKPARRTCNGKAQRLPMQRRMHEKPPYHQPQKQRSSEDRSWTVRWVRSGYEQLVYDICNCNEAPNVVFAGLCYRQSDVFTMVLRNCDGKRRYWYDKSTRSGQQLPHGAVVSDFERAMRWRSNTVGRVSTSPGYDLAAFVLQNVAPDKRCVDVVTSTSSGSPPLIVVTTDNMLHDSTINRQLLYVEKKVMSNYVQSDRPTGPYYRDQRQQLTKRVACRVCRCCSGIVTHDNASVPVFTCWQHSASYMAGASADSTRVCNAVVVDMQFLEDEDPMSDEMLVCRLRLIHNGGVELPSQYTRKTNNNSVDGSCVMTIAELVVSSPFGVHRSNHIESERPIDLETAHAATCRDRHYNVEDLFPSMPIHGSSSGSGGGVQYYDTTIGLVVDRIHCIASTFQR